MTVRLTGQRLDELAEWSARMRNPEFGQAIRELQTARKREEWLTTQLTHALHSAQSLEHITDLAIARALAGDLRDALHALGVHHPTDKP